MRKVGTLFLAVVLCVVTVPISGCSTAQAQKTQGVIQAIISVALAETQLVPAEYQTKWTSYWGAVQVADTALAGCIASAGSVMHTGSKVSACFSVFGKAFSDPANLVLLRVIDPKSQSKAQLYISSVAAAIAIIVAFTAPSVGPPPTAQEMHDLGVQAGLTDREMLQFGY